MFWRRAMSAAGALALLAAASWLPARASDAPAAGLRGAIDLARPPLSAPASWPTHPAGPVEAVAAFLWSLSAAVAGNAQPPAPPPASSAAQSATQSASSPGSSSAPGPAAGPGVGDSVALPFSRAYAYLSPQWQARQPFADFVRTWAATRHLDPLAIIAAGSPPDGDPRTVRVFTEVRMLSAAPGDPRHISLSFAAGFYVAAPSPQGWRLESGGLRTEDFGLVRGSGTAPGPEAAAEAAARQTATRLGRPGATGPARVRVETRPDHQATASVRLGEGQDVYSVRLYQLADAQWVALSVQR